MLTHRQGLCHLSRWTQTVKDSAFMTEYYHTERTSEYPLQVAPGYLQKPLARFSLVLVVKSKMSGETRAHAVPLPIAQRPGLMIMKQLAERLLNQPIDEFLRQNVYEPQALRQPALIHWITTPSHVLHLQK